MVIAGIERFDGTIEIQGAKNTAQKLIPMCTLVPGVHTLRRVPMIRDTNAVLRIVEYLGGSVTVSEGHVVIDSRNVVSRPIPRSLTREATGTFLYAGALLGRFGTVDIGLPGGDAIGLRPVDLHLEMFAGLGADCKMVGDRLCATVVRDGARTLEMPIRSAGALVNAVQLAFGRGGSFQIANVPMDSDIRAALEFLRQLGATVGVVEGLSRRVHIESRGVTEQRDTTVELPADRNDAATWLLAAGIGQGSVSVKGFPVEELRLILSFLEDLGADIQIQPDHSVVRVDCSAELHADGYTLILGPSPEFHSDWGPFAEALLARAHGTSVVEDRMYEARYRHVDELMRLGADIRYVQRPVPKGALMFDCTRQAVTALEIHGGRRFRGGEVRGEDVRGAASLALAGAAAKGETSLAGVDQLERGYENFVQRLKALGVESHLA